MPQIFRALTCFIVLLPTVLTATATASPPISDGMIVDLMESPPSTRWLDRVYSDDGRVNILQPLFGFAGGEIRRIAAHSNLDGVCRLYGFGPAVRAGTLSSFDNLPVAVISANGQFARVDGIPASTTTDFDSIDNLMCESSQTPKFSSATIFKNDDGTFTVTEMAFFGPRKEYFDIALMGSSLEGICRRFGLKNPLPTVPSVSRGFTTEKSGREQSVAIGADGKVISVGLYPERSVLKSLICREQL